MEKPIQIFVIGRLGELIKKMVELELIIESGPKQEVAILELAAYTQVMAAWPIENPATLSILFADFRIALRKLQAANECFEKAVEDNNLINLCIQGKAYLRARNALKAKIKSLNAMGRYVGNVPLMNMTLQFEQEKENGNESS